jgi:hypothetical protein
MPKWDMRNVSLRIPHGRFVTAGPTKEEGAGVRASTSARAEGTGRMACRAICV